MLRMLRWITVLIKSNFQVHFIKKLTDLSFYCNNNLQLLSAIFPHCLMITLLYYKLVLYSTFYKLERKNLKKCII
jgi:hypothetical protein